MIKRYTFEVVSVKGTRRWTDDNGKKRQKTRTFSQTMNPFNKNVRGEPKTRMEIVGEITAARDAWLKEGTS